MASKYVVLAVLVSITMVLGRTTSSDDTSITFDKQEGKFLDMPITTGVIFTSIKVIWYLISWTWSLVVYKLTFLALLTKMGGWAFENCYTLLLAAAAILGFCKLTGKYNVGLLQSRDATSEESLSSAMRNFVNGARKYGRYLN